MPRCTDSSLYLVLSTSDPTHCTSISLLLGIILNVALPFLIHNIMPRASLLPPKSSNPNSRAILSFEERCLQFPCGQLIQALRVNIADLMLLEYQDSRVLRFLRRGEFMMKLVKHSFSPIVVAACTVECIHWPLARDAPVFRIGVRSFLMAVPGLLYALRFPRSCPEQRMVFLEVLFMRFCDYADFSHIQSAMGASENDPDFWMRARDQIRSTLDSKLLQSGHFIGLSPTAVGDQSSELLRVCRASGTAQVVMKAILAGILQSTHTDIHEMRADAKNPRRPVDIPEAYPKISVFTNIIEALELAWVTTSGSSHLLREAAGKSATLQPSDFNTWSLNESGVVCLVELLVHTGETLDRNSSNQPRSEPEEGTEINKEGGEDEQMNPEIIFPIMHKGDY
ncbi:hypothetical protein CK203_001855 [Vitis vinifera]|uniref:Uncharacterized protein n=1 Tax=Vitis vinifera TaxID=29760 RepID=A0A438KJ03_VITVI|nr:hypothetical protein CK203_001855 [Vitis vinifera]